MSEHAEVLNEEKIFNQVLPDVRGSVVPRMALIDGALVQYKHRRRFESVVDGQRRISYTHTFVNRCGRGKPFAVFGTAELNSMLAKVAENEILMLRYKGIEQNEKKQDVHKWIVSVARADMKTQAFKLMAEREPELAKLDRAIEVAEKEDENRRMIAAGVGPIDDGAPPPDDSDLPF